VVSNFIIIIPQFPRAPSPENLRLQTVQRRVVPHGHQYRCSGTVSPPAIRTLSHPPISLLHLVRSRTDVPRRTRARHDRAKGKRGNETEPDVFGRMMFLYYMRLKLTCEVNVHSLMFICTVCICNPMRSSDGLVKAGSCHHPRPPHTRVSSLHQRVHPLHQSSDSLSTAITIQVKMGKYPLHWRIKTLI
jgi:hypothetical protein